MLRLTLAESIAALRWSLREAGAHLGCSHEQVRLMCGGASLERFAGKIVDMENAARDVLAARRRLENGKGIEG